MIISLERSNLAFEGWQPGMFAAGSFVSPSGQTRGKKAAFPAAQRKTPTVLVVDDERLIADTMKEILSLAGFNALCAYDGKEALALALRAKPDYVLSDVVMPFMNGVELAIAIQEALPATNIVLLSGQAGVTDLLDRGREQGYTFELLAKPIHPEKLIARLKKK